LLRAGNNRAARIPIMAITTSSSMSVNPIRRRTAFHASALRHLWLGLPGILGQTIAFAGDFSQLKKLISDRAKIFVEYDCRSISLGREGNRKTAFHDSRRGLRWSVHDGVEERCSNISAVAPRLQRWVTERFQGTISLGIVGGAAKGEGDVVFSECGTGFGNRIYFVLLFRAALLVGLQTGRQRQRVSGDLAGLFNDCLLVLGVNSVV